MASSSIRTVSPASGEIIFESPGATIEDAKQTVHRSSKSFETFKGTSLEYRKSIVARAVELLHEKREDLGRELTVQMGRPIAYTPKEIDTMRSRAEYMLKLADEALAQLPGEPEPGTRRFVTREPLGPVLLIFPWNFPYLTLINALVPALLAGNTVILKPSPQTPLVANRIQECFREAGLPEDVIQIIQSASPETLSNIAALPGIKLVVFTGSNAGGIGLRQAIAKRLVPAVFELGGKDPAYVRSDADIELTAAGLVDGAIFNSGQSCCSVERIYVHADVHDALVEAMRKELLGYKIGNPLDEAVQIGPVVSHASACKIEAHVSDALEKGALDCTPSSTIPLHLANRSSYVLPRLLTNVDHSMLVMTEETFGPLIPIAKVGNDEEALTLMNDSEYGLTASIWTKDIKRGEELAAKLESGTVFINRCDYPSPDLAWTGWKDSGMGCSLGPKAFDGFVRLKSHHIREVTQ